jgi:hypothetical protein
MWGKEKGLLPPFVLLAASQGSRRAHRLYQGTWNTPTSLLWMWGCSYLLWLLVVDCWFTVFLFIFRIIINFFICSWAPLGRDGSV